MTAAIIFWLGCIALSIAIIVATIVEAERDAADRSARRDSIGRGRNKERDNVEVR